MKSNNVSQTYFIFEMGIYRTIEEVSREVVGCRLCKRLVKYRESLPPRSSHKGETYWRRPVPGFGDPNAHLVVIGLAPAAHGGNRTGRVFTGDESGRFLMRALNEAGYSNQPISESRDDGLVLYDCYITAAVKCSPPKNRPTKKEFENCSIYLERELSLLTSAKSVLVLGRLAFASFLQYASGKGAKTRGLEFEHGRSYSLPGFPTLYASYHPSPRNTYTGKLTKRMLSGLVRRIKKETNSLISR